MLISQHDAVSHGEQRSGFKRIASSINDVTKNKATMQNLFGAIGVHLILC